METAREVRVIVEQGSPVLVRQTIRERRACCLEREFPISQQVHNTHIEAERLGRTLDGRLHDDRKLKRGRERAAQPEQRR